MTKKKPEVCIIWRDAEDGSTWMGQKEAEQFADQECLVRSRGILVRKTKNFVVLAADDTLSGNHPGEYGRICKIPSKMIVSIMEVPHAPDYNPPAPVARTPSIPSKGRGSEPSHHPSQPEDDNSDRKRQD